jgi:Tol biopolymer transport system component
MGEPSRETPPSPRPPGDRLDSWKEIASYLDRDVTTVQRWEKREGMPVHRHLHDRIGSVYASREELDAWARSRRPQAGLEGERDGAVPAPQRLPEPLAVPKRPNGWRLVLGLAAAAAVTFGVGLWLRKTDRIWRNPVAGARFEAVTDFEGVAQAAAVSRDGQFVAFVADRDGPVDLWLTQVGSGLFHNLTRGSVRELVNPSVRTLGFSPNGSLVTFWVRRPNGSTSGDISVWAVPTLGGPPRPYLQGVAEFDWSRDGSRLAYHTAASGDPLFVSDGAVRPESRPIFAAPPGLHCHFPLWAPDGAFVYFVTGAVPDAMDVWRVPPGGGAPERITSHRGRVSHPAMLDERTLVYLADDPDGSGPWLYGMDVERRVPHRLTSGLDRYSSVAASADGRRLVATLANRKSTLWRLRVSGAPSERPSAAVVSLPTRSGSSPRLGPGYLVYVAASGTGDGIWKLAGGGSTELWRGTGAQVLGGPALSYDGRHVAFSIRREGRTLLCAMEADGTNARTLIDSLELVGAPAWAPDARSITTAAVDRGVTHLFRVPLDGGAPAPLVDEPSVFPAWAPDGRFVAYLGPDIGAQSPVKAATPGGAAHALPPLTLPRGARRLAFLDGGRTLVFLRGDLRRQELWRVDLETGAERPLADLGADFDVRDFDVSRDGTEVVLEREQDRSDVVFLDLPGR